MATKERKGVCKYCPTEDDPPCTFYLQSLFCSKGETAKELAEIAARGSNPSDDDDYVGQRKRKYRD